MHRPTRADLRVEREVLNNNLRVATCVGRMATTDQQHVRRVRVDDISAALGDRKL